MSSETETEGYIVYIPEGPTTSTNPFRLSKDAEVADLKRAIHALWDEERGKTIYLYKCGDLSRKPEGGDLYGDALEWLRKDDLMPKRMDSSDQLDDYFPEGPTPYKDEMIDVIVATGSILVSLGLLKADISTGVTLSLKGARFDDDDDAVIRGAATPKGDDRGYDDRSYRLQGLVHSQDQILVLDGYRTLFNRVIAFKQEFPFRGVLVTGQPGTGKTTWLWFMLICLIMKRQVVAFYSENKTRLLYNGRVYLAGVHDTVELPPSFIKDQTIWCLIDSDATPNAPPPYLVSNSTRFIFPVQAASPDDVRYKIWSKKRFPATFGMPLWSKEELKQGYKLQSNYTTSRARRVEEAIEKYGNAPRDVYNAIIDPTGVEIDINMALDLCTLGDIVSSVNELALVFPIWSDRSLPNTLLAINPMAGDQHDDFIPRFRSERIGRRTIERFGFLQHQHAQLLSHVYRMLPHFSTLAGWIFEGLVHGILSNTYANSRSRIEWKLVPMVSIPTVHDVDGLRFSLSPAHHDHEPFPLTDKKFTVVEFSGGDLNWPPHKNHIHALEGCLCVPKRPHNFSFNSFFVELKVSALLVTPIVWIFQTTVPEHHEQDWPLIDSIKNKAAERAKSIYDMELSESEDDVSAKKAGDRTSPARKRKRESETVGARGSVKTRMNEVQVNYVLVRPYPVQACTWTMPEGWRISAEGMVFCLFIDI